MLKYRTKEGLAVYNRHCKRCEEDFESLNKRARVCPECNNRRDYIEEFRQGVKKEFRKLSEEIKKP